MSPTAGLVALDTRVRRRPEVAALLLVVPVVLLLPGSVPPGVLALGLVAAAPVALHAAGIVLVFRSNRFVDFAQLQLGAVAATLFALVVNTRAVERAVGATCPPCLASPAPGWFVTTVYWGSLAVGLLTAAGVAWLSYLLVFRRLARAPRLVATVASIFLITALAGVQRLLIDVLSDEEDRLRSNVVAALPPPFTWQVQVGDAVRLNAPDLLSVVVATVLIGGVALFLRRSATGTQIRAASEDPARAATLGVDVVRVTGRVWLMVGVLSGSAALLGAMSSQAGDGENPASASTLVRILVVVVVARFTSLAVAGVAAVALGVLSASVQFATGSTTVLDGLLVVVVAGLLLLQRREQVRADRDTSSAYLAGRQVRPIPAALRDLPPVRRARATGRLLLVGTMLAAPFLLSPSQTSTLSTTLVLAIVGVSLLVLTGWAGQVSLGQFALAAVGAYVVAVTGLPFLLALPLGGLAGAVVAVLVGLPALRLQGLTLAVSTLAFALSVTALLLNADQLGRYLPDEVDRPALLGTSLDDQRASYFVALAVLVLAVLAVAGLRSSRTGRVLIAARDNEVAVQSFGIDLLRARLSAFALSGTLAGVAGGLYAYQQASVSPSAFAPELSLLVFTWTVIGGLGSLAGPLLGFAALAALSLATKDAAVLTLVNGFGGLLLILAAPGGLAAVAYDVRDGLLRRLAQRRGLVVPGLGGATASGAAPIRPATGPGGSEVLVPARYRLPGQWAVSGRAREAADAGRKVRT